MTDAAIAVVMAVAATSCAAPGSTAHPAPPRSDGVALGLASAIGGDDQSVWAPDAVASVIGESGEARGRDEIVRAVTALRNHFPGSQLAFGRSWLDPPHAVVELVASGTRDTRAFGVVGAAAIALDDRGRIRKLRLYVDEMTLVGQLTPERLPAGRAVRPPITQPPSGGASIFAQHTPAEAANLKTADEIWAALGRHDAAAALAPSSTDYVYEDYGGPAPLDRAATQQLVARLVEAIPDFSIAEEPTHFAAGDDVITEMVEHGTFGGRAITLHGLDVKQLRDGRVVREWQYANGQEAEVALFGHAPIAP